MLINDIEKIVKTKKITEKYNIKKENLVSIILYEVLQNSFFKESYKFLGLIKEAENISIYIPELTRIKGFPNQKISSSYLDIKYGLEEINYESKIEKFISNEELIRLNKMINLLKQSKTAIDLNLKIIEEQNKDILFLHTINRFFIIEDDNIKNDLVREIISINSKMNFNEKEEIYMSCLHFKNILNFNENFHKEFLSNNVLDMLVKYNKINGQTKKEKEKSAIEYFKERKIPSSIIKILLSSEDNEIKNKKILDYFFIKLKDEIIIDYSNYLKEYKSIEIIKEKYKNITNIVIEELRNKYIELNGNYEIDFTLITSTDKAYNELKKLNKLSLNTHNVSSDLKFNGISYCANAIKEELSDQQKYLLIKTENQVIGILVFNEDIDNVLKIEYIEINKNLRNKGVSKKVLKWLSDYSIKNNKLIFSSMYTNNGSQYLPNEKAKLNKEFDCLFLEKELKGFQYSKEIGDINENLYSKVSKMSKFDLKIFKRNYNKAINTILNINPEEVNLDVSFRIKIENEIINNTINDIINKKKKRKNGFNR